MSEEIESVEMPAPVGWKKYIPKDGPPKRNGVIFISPEGDEIRNRKHLGQFLRSHPGGPSPSEFDWGYGDTLRRSVRIREKVKATESAEEDPPKKRQRKSNSSKGKRNRNDEVTEEEQVDEVPKTDTQAVESVADALIKKDGEDGSVEEKVDSAARTNNDNNLTVLAAEDKTVEEREVKTGKADQDLAEVQKEKERNELKNLEVEHASKDPPALPLPEATKVETSVAREEHEKLELEEPSKVVPDLSLPEVTEENSDIKEFQVDAEVAPHENLFNKEDLQDKKVTSEEALFNKEDLHDKEVTPHEPLLNKEDLHDKEVAPYEDLCNKEDLRDKEVTPHAALFNKEDLHDEEVKGRILYNNNINWEQKV